MATTIQISTDMKETLNKMKLSGRETYEEIIERIIEDTMELSEETKKDIEESRKQIKAGRFKTLAQIKKELKL